MTCAEQRYTTMSHPHDVASSIIAGACAVALQLKRRAVLFARCCV